MKEFGKIIKDTVEVLLASIIAVFVLLKFVISPCQIVGTSMYPTLKDGQSTFSLKFMKYIDIDRFDICVLDVSDKDNEKLIVKRIIGLPNETIEYKDNKLYVNGEYIAEDFLSGVTTDDLRIVLGEDEYFCLGDNREVSKDSRYYGAFSKNDIDSLKMLVFYPFTEFGVR